MSTPSYGTLELVVSDILADEYPFMFKDIVDSRRPELTMGYGRGGALGNKTLHKQIWQKVYNRQMEERKQILLNREKSGEVEPGEILKHGCTVATFGIDSYKYYSVASDIQRDNIKNTEDEEDIEARERIYERNRPALAMEIRRSQKNVSQIINGFWSSPKHLHRQFVYVTNGVDNIRVKIASNWEAMMESFQKYIVLKDKSMKFTRIINEVQSQVLTEYSGVTTLLHVEIVRAVCNLLDKGGDGRAFILKEGEDSVGEGVPFLLMKEKPDR